MWVLIIVYSAYYWGGVAKPIEFSNKEKCEITAAKINRDMQSFKAFCVEK